MDINAISDHDVIKTSELIKASFKFLHAVWL